MNKTKYASVATDIWVELDSTGTIVHLMAPDMNVNIASPLASLKRGTKLSAVVPILEPVGEVRNSDRFVCTGEVMDLIKQVQGEPALLEKVTTIVEAYKALNGN